MSAEHDIEEGARIYLEMLVGEDGEYRWAVDRVTVDGYPLDSTRDDGANCDITHEGEAATEECQEMLNAADNLSLPTAQELIPLIAENMTGPEIAKAIKELTELLAKRVPEPK